MSSDLIRMTGLNSGLDTEAIITAYTSKASKKVQDAKNKKTLNTWTQSAWQDINTKIFSFYNKTLSNNRLSKAYKKTKVTTSNSALTVVAGANAVNGIQTAKIKGLAKAAYMTGSKIENLDGEKLDPTAKLTEELGITEGSTITIKGNNGKEKTIQIGGEAQEGSDAVVVNSMNELVKTLKDAGVNANYDAGNQRLFLQAKDTGVANDFSFSGDVDTLMKLGLANKEQVKEATPDFDSLTKEEQDKLLAKAATKIDGSDAKLELNGAEFTSTSNTFIINGSTYTINNMPANEDEEISITTQPDYDGVYNVIKDMLKEYNDLIGEMSKLYNADSSKGYEPLTDDQKSAMSEKEIEEWEKKIKDSLLRKDNTLYDVMMTMVNVTNEGFMVNGKKMYLADFGIATGGYFDTDEESRYMLHIDGDSDDTMTGTKDDKLMSLIASDPEAVTSFFQQFSNKMYDDLFSKMGTSEFSSIYKVYNDKQLKSEATEWDKKIAELEKALTDMEDRYYQKFSRMETALAKLNSKQTAVAGMFGGM
ncbi:MAG: flagellar filament capping protein FliD [Lachnospiraceae bacterium]|nr:flagellar filament capping protein FliD [Lachnospiraceae bacterium]